MKENYQWKVLLKTSATEEGEYLHVPHPHVRSFPAGHNYSRQHLRQFGADADHSAPSQDVGKGDEAKEEVEEEEEEEEEDASNGHMGGYLDHDLFVLAWGPTIAALSFVFDKSEDAAIAQKAVAGFKKCALVAATYGLSDVFDNLVISLCKFTTLMSSSSHAVASAATSGSNLAESAEGLGLAVHFGNALKVSRRKASIASDVAILAYFVRNLYRGNRFSDAFFL